MSYPIYKHRFIKLQYTIILYINIYVIYCILSIFESFDFSVLIQTIFVLSSLKYIYLKLCYLKVNY